MTDDRWLTVDVQGDEDAERKIRTLALFLADLRPFWPRVSTLTTSWIRRNFETEGVFWGLSKWTALSPAYAERKRILWGDRPILQASRQMKKAFSKPERQATPRTLTLVFDDAGEHHGPVAQYHQEGDGVPRRPIIGETLPPVAVLELEAAGRAYVTDLLRRF